MNAEEFYNHMNRLPDEYTHRDLEEYLLALYKLVIEPKESELNYRLILKMIKDAFVTEAFEFQEEWLNCSIAPDEDDIDNANTESGEMDEQAHSPKYTPYDFTIAVLKFQIAELHKMQGKQLENKFRYFGIESETGHDWYNFDPFGNLECGAAGMMAHRFDFSCPDWSFLGKLLEMGRIYE